jgi:hypothetical protein
MTMVNDAVNKLIIEITCNSESTAQEVSRDIANFWTYRFSEIISRISSMKIDSKLIWKIDRLEFELGDIFPGEVSSQELYTKFESLLTETVEKAISMKSEGIELAGTTSVQILKTLLLTGDLPWWMNKSGSPDFDGVLKSAYEVNNEELKQFLFNHKDNSDVINRIHRFFSTGMVRLLTQMFPELHKKGDLYFFKPEKIYWDKITGSRLHAMAIALKKPYRSSGFKYLLVQNLIENQGLLLMQGIILLDAFSEKQLYELESELTSGKTHLKTESHLMQLKLYELEFLMHPEIWKTQSQALNPATSGRNTALKKVKMQEIQKFYLKSRVELIINHSAFLANNVMKLLLSVSPLSGASPIEISDNQLDFLAYLQRLQKTQNHLHNKIKKLSRRQITHLKEVIRRQEYPSGASKRTVEQILKKLPQKDLQMISQLIQLSKSEIEIVTQTFDPDTFKKTIVENAGLCILAPFFPSLFNKLGFMRDGKFKSKYAAHRAVYLLEYMVNGRQKNAEYKLQLNKLLCGMDVEEPITAFKRLKEVEKQEANDLISSVIGHWKALKSTSVKGLQSSFIQRKGILTEKNDNWILQVEKTAFDLLLDNMPWNYRIIKFSWMKKMIEVEW